jgi:hypothetical protein
MLPLHCELQDVGRGLEAQAHSYRCISRTRSRVQVVRCKWAISKGKLEGLQDEVQYHKVDNAGLVVSSKVFFLHQC